MIGALPYSRLVSRLCPDSSCTTGRIILVYHGQWGIPNNILWYAGLGVHLNQLYCYCNVIVLNSFCNKDWHILPFTHIFCILPVMSHWGKIVFVV